MLKSILIVLFFSQISVCLFSKDIKSADTFRKEFRVFPELQNFYIKKIIYKDPSTIFIKNNSNDIWRWTGKNWKRLSIPSKLKNFIIHLFPYDSTHYLINYFPQERYYHSKLMLFDGTHWKKIPSIQPYQIHDVSFLSKNSFWAGGLWGSLLFYDGQQSKVIPPYPGFDFNKIWAFDKNLFIVLAGGDQRNLLLKYHKGKWITLYSTKRGLKNTYFWHADSGFIFDSQNRILFFTNNQVKELNISINHSYCTLVPKQKKLYFWKDHYFWNISSTGKLKKLFPFQNPANIYPLGSHSYLIYFKEQLFYRGNDSLGQPIKTMFPRFKRKILSLQNHLSVSVYTFKNGTKGLYLSKPLEINSFLRLFYGSSSLLPYKFDKIKDQIFNTGLLDIVKNKYLWDASLSFGDLDNDGDRDAILANLKGPCLIFENIGNDRFRNISDEIGFKISGRINLIHLVDLDADGYLDFVAGNEQGPMYFFRNQGFMRFENITQQLGFEDSLITYLPAFADLDGDGDADFIAYSQYKPIKYYENTGPGLNGLPQFVDRSLLSPELTSRFEYFTQSVSFADYDNDGDLDILLANRNASLKFFENKGKHHFVDITEQKRLDYKFLSYGASWGDLNQDGFQDFVLTTLGKNYIFWNQNSHFFKIDSTSLPQNKLSYTTSSVIEDLDDDGDLDIVFCNLYFNTDEIYFNLLEKNSFIKIKLQCKTDYNYEGIGSSIYLYENNSSGQNRKLIGYQYIRPETGYNSFKLPLAYFSVNPDKKYMAIIKFPDNKTRYLYNLEAGKTYLISQKKHVSLLQSFFMQVKPWFLRKSKKEKVFKFLVFLFIIGTFNLYIKKRTYWPFIHIIFFNTFLISTYLIGHYLFNNIFNYSGQVAPFYLLLATGIGTFILVDRYTFFRYGEIYKQEIFDLFRQLHHSKSGIAQINHLIFFCNNIKPNTPQHVQNNFMDELDFFQRYSIPFIRTVLFKSIRLNHLRPLSEKTLKLLKTLQNKITRKQSFQSWNDQNLTSLRDSLTRLKNNLMVLRRKLELDFSCNVMDIITQTLRKFTKFTEVRLLNLCNSQNVKALIPAESLSLVMSNLFQNALEAMSDMSEKKIDIVVQKTFNQIQIELSDSGPGIDKKLYKKIFEENFSTKNSTGIGLYHAQKILKRFGGQISLVKNNKVKGATFRITLKGIE